MSFIGQRTHSHWYLLFYQTLKNEFIVIFIFNEFPLNYSTLFFVFTLAQQFNFLF